MQDNLLIPDQIKTARNVNNSNIKIDFLSDKSGCASIVLTQDKLIGLVSTLQKEIEDKKIVPIHPDHMAPGTVHRIVSVQVKTNPSDLSQTLLVLGVDFPDRGVRSEIPLSMTPEDKAYIIEALSR